MTRWAGDTFNCTSLLNYDIHLERLMSRLSYYAIISRRSAVSLSVGSGKDELDFVSFLVIDERQDVPQVDGNSL